MSCYKIEDENGENDPRFLALVESFKGDEESALKEYVKSFVLKKGRFQYSVSDDYKDSEEFLKGSFSVNDKFTPSDEIKIKNNKDSYYKEKSVDGSRKFIFYNANGTTEIIDPSDLDTKINQLIKDKKSMNESLVTKLQKLFEMNVPGKDFSGVIQKSFARLNPSVMFSFLSGLNKNNITSYSDLSSKSWFIPSLSEEKIMIHEQEVNGVKEYTIMLPTLDSRHKDLNGSGSRSFMSNVFGNSKSAEQKGFNIKNNLEGRKHLIGTMVALAIKSAEPNAKINSLRFASFQNRGTTFNMDLNQGLENLQALNQNPETVKIIPAELKDILDSTEDLTHQSIGSSYMEQLYRNEYAKKGMEDTYVDYSLLRNIEEKNIDDVIKDISRRIFFLVRTYDQPGPNGIKPIEDPAHSVGQEMYLLAKAKEELIQSNGMDKRTYNTNDSLSNWGSWRRSVTEIQNAQLNMVYNEFNSVAFGYKQRFDDSLKEKAPLIKEYISAYESDNGASVKSRALNYTEKAYENLYEKVKMKTYQDGQVSTEMVDVNIRKFKDPDDLSNGLKDYERKFIKGIVAYHKKSIIRLIGKKIESREISSDVYKSSEDWYNAKYKNQELLMPVMRKKSGNFLAEGNVKNAFSSALEEGNQFLEVTPRDLMEDRIYRSEGSATMQIGNKYGSDGRLKSLGIQEINGEFVLVNPAVNSRSMGDVEQIMHSSVFQNFKFEFEPTLVSTYAAAKIILIQESMKTGISRKNELKHLEALFNNMLYGEREKIVQGNKNPEKALDLVRGVTSTATLALNWKSMALATSGNMFALVSNAISNRFGKEYFNGKDLLTSFTWATKNSKKFGAIVDAFMFHDANESALVFSSKYKAGEKGFVKNHHLMLMHNLGDRFTRGLVLISQLKHEGLLDNFILDEAGNAKYDWSLDKRSEKIKNHIREKNAKQEKRDLPYDDVQINTLVSITAKMFGAYTDEDRTRIQTNGLAQWAGQFKGYLIARSNELIQSGFDNTNIAWYSEDEKGNLKLSAFYQEGMANTFFHFLNEVKRMEGNPIEAWKNMKPEQKKNMQKLIADAIMFGSLMLIYGAVIAAGDDEDKKLTPAQRKSKQAAYQYLKYAFLDIVGVYNVNDYVDGVTPASIPVIKRYGNALIDFVTLDFEGSFDKAVMKTGPGKTATDIISVFQ